MDRRFFVNKITPAGQVARSASFGTTSKSAWIGGNEEDGGKLLKCMSDARFSLFDTDYEIKTSEVVIFC